MLTLRNANEFFDVYRKLYCVFIKTKYPQLQPFGCLSHAGKLIVKHFRLYVFFTILGIVLLSILFKILADRAFGNYVWSLFSNIQHLLTCLWCFCVLGGPLFLAVGIVGIGRQYLMNSPNPFTRRRVDSFSIVAVMIILSVVFGLFLYFWMGALTVA